MNGLDQAIKLADGVAALARKVGVVQGAVSNWRARGGVVPVKNCTAVERAVGGLVTRKDLRPHDWQEHWPELAQNQPPALAHAAPAATKTVAQA